MFIYIYICRLDELFNEKTLWKNLPKPWVELWYLLTYASEANSNTNFSCT